MNNGERSTLHNKIGEASEKHKIDEIVEKIKKFVKKGKSPESSSNRRNIPSLICP